MVPSQVPQPACYWNDIHGSWGTWLHGASQLVAAAAKRWLMPTLESIAPLSVPICTNTTQLFLFHPNAATRVNTSRFNNGINATSMTRVTPCNNYMYTISMQLKAANITNRQTQQYSYVWAYSLHCLLCKKAVTEEAELLSINILLPIHEHYDHDHDEDGNIGYGWWGS